MRITLDIPSEHTAEILATLAKLMKPATVEAQPDPAEGHPELPLADESEEIAETRWAPVPGIDAADPMQVEMDDPAELPFPKDFPELPELPEGKTRWVYRGIFRDVQVEDAPEHAHREIRYWSTSDLKNGNWETTTNFSTEFHHIEAL